MKTTVYSSLILLLLAIISCKDDNPSIDYFAINQDDTITHVLESNWEFLGMLDEQNEKATPFPENLNTVFLSFDSANNFVAEGLCNTIQGHFVKSPENILELNDYSFSTDDCSGGEATQWENTFLNNLNQTVSYAITGDILSLHTGGSDVLKFRFESDKIITDPTCFDFENNYHDVSLERNWLFLGYVDSLGTSQCKPYYIREMSLEFIAPDTIYGISAVNYLDGKYEMIGNDSIVLIDLMTTLMYHVDSIIKWDDVYLDVDHGNLKYKMDIAGIKLSLTANNKNEYIFRAEGY